MKMKAVVISVLGCLLLVGGALGRSKEEWKSRIIYQVGSQNSNVLEDLS